MTEPYYLPPPPPPPATAAAASTRAVTSLVLGILSIVCCGLCGPFAWHLGNQELVAIRAGSAPPGGETWATAGKILGIIGSVLLVISLLGIVLWVFSFGGMMLLQGFAANH